MSGYILTAWIPSAPSDKLTAAGWNISETRDGWVKVWKPCEGKFKVEDYFKDNERPMFIQLEKDRK